ncbi:YicC family protein [Epibacterium ulvae]|uniref:YicC/YloC family endoribonuclease n=1 Tax=Epibacterium ulvae TaxID=1156985 RepID=UPI001BFC9A76|nr:YicC/YloC family endoribonuclease [Epibacterium ulvae]MBT8154459.1 YicC family protein [Epibacterium ulvae]
MSICSMTGFASSQGTLDTHAWSWEIRSVNAKGLDLRLRVPDWLDGLEKHLRGQLDKGLSRGNVSLALRISSEAAEGQRFSVNATALNSVLHAMAKAETAAKSAGVDLDRSSVADLLSIRGVLEQEQNETDPAPLVAALKKDFETLLAEFVQMRGDEGRALEKVLTSQLQHMDDLRRQAVACVAARQEGAATAFKAALSRVIDNVDGLDADRVAQELALLAVKADITEELDRLEAHIAAAHDLLSKGGAVGRRFDFLMQEFNREANTLCSKSQHSALTSVGLEMKAVIDQMREQVQNIE